MRKLPLYAELPYSPLEKEEARDLDPECERCTLSQPWGNQRVKHVCMPGDLVPGDASVGTLLCVTDYPGDEEDRAGRPSVGGAGKMLRYIVRQHWRGPVIFDNAVRCRPGAARKVTPKHVKACRGFLAGTYEEAAPRRIVVLGAHGVLSVLGRAVPLLSARRGYGWVANPLTPVFMLVHPTAAARNRFVRKWFEKDLEWALTCDLEPLKERIQWDNFVNVVENAGDARQAYLWAKQQRFIAYDYETAGRLFETGSDDEPRFRTLVMSIASPDPSTDTWSFPSRVVRKDPQVRKWLRRILEDETIPKVGQNEKFDRQAAGRDGHIVSPPLMDTRLIRKLQFADADARLEVMQETVGMGGGKREMDTALKDVIKKARAKPSKKLPERGSDEYLERLFGKDADLARAIRRGHSKPKKYAFGLVPRDLNIRYNALDSKSTAMIADRQRPLFEQEPQHLQDVWHDLVRPLSLAVAKVEEWGVYIDRDAVDAFQTCAQLQMQAAIDRIMLCAEEHNMPDFSPKKTADVATLLFDKLRLKPIKKSKKTNVPSTDKETLEALASKHPVVADLQLWRKADKKSGTYGDSIEKFIHSDGRIHPNVLIDGARSGRPSCSEPNAYNLPRPEDKEDGEIDLGRMARDMYAVPKGKRMISFDLSQMELRVMAMETGDPNALDIFMKQQDYHFRTAQMVSHVWGKKPHEIPKKGKERSESKAINFGVLYGMGPFTLAKNIKLYDERGRPDEAAAQRTMNAILGKFKLLRHYLDECKSEARRDGQVWTRWGDGLFRRRPLWRVADPDGDVRSRAEHGSWNTKIQGRASDWCLFSLVECVKWILEEGIEEHVKLVLSIYDSLMFEVSEHFVDEVLSVVPKLMLKWPHRSVSGDPVPVVVDADGGPAYGSLEKIGSYCNMILPDAA